MSYGYQGGFPGDNSQGGYNQGGYQEQGGYNQGGYQEQGGYSQGYQEQGGYNQGGYQEQGGYSQGYQPQGGYNQGDIASVSPASLNENASVAELISQLAGDPSLASSMGYVQPVETSARDLADFDIDEFEREFGSADMSRGIFGFDSGHGKSKTSHQLIGGAAAWAAFKWYENWKRNTKGEKVNHSFIKKMLTAVAVAQVIKIAEKRSSSFQEGVSRDLAVEQAVRDIGRISDIKYSGPDTSHVYSDVHGGEADSFNAGRY